MIMCYTASIQESLTDTELRNISARYNPMTLQEFFDLFNLVQTIIIVCIVCIVIVPHRIGSNILMRSSAELVLLHNSMPILL